jgi:hypothetical protein
MQNKITEQEISKILEERNIAEDFYDLDFDDATIVVRDHFDYTITKDFEQGEYKFYEETTADGYTVYVATCDGSGWSKPSISEDVYYYETDWLDMLPEAMRTGATIYLEDGISSGYEFEDVIKSMYESYLSDKIAEVEQELIEKGWEHAE